MDASALFVSIGAWLGAHQQLAYGILFLGMYFETIIGIGFFLPGELFLIPGSILAGAGVLNVWLTAAAFYAGGILGDSSSYWIGRRASDEVRMFFKKENRLFSEDNYRLGVEFFERQGPKAIFFARLAGPFSWVTPFLAGAAGVPYSTFLLYNVPGVLVGIGQFLVAGYFFGNNFAAILSLAQRSLLAVLLPVGAIVILWVMLKKWKWGAK